MKKERETKNTANNVLQQLTKKCNEMTKLNWSNDQ